MDGEVKFSSLLMIAMPSRNKIYRDGSQDPYTVNGFWTPDPGYVKYCKTGVSSLWEANIKQGARIIKLSGSPSKKITRQYQKKADVLEFETWDYDTTELVILNPEVILNVKKIMALANGSSLKMGMQGSRK